MRPANKSRAVDVGGRSAGHYPLITDCDQEKRMPIIEMQHLRKRYRDTVALDDVR